MCLHIYIVLGFRENFAQALSGRQKFTQAGSLCWQKCNVELPQPSRQTHGCVQQVVWQHQQWWETMSGQPWQKELCGFEQWLWAQELNRPNNHSKKPSTALSGSSKSSEPEHASCDAVSSTSALTGTLYFTFQQSAPAIQNLETPNGWTSPSKHVLPVLSKDTHLLIACQHSYLKKCCYWK